MKIQIHLKVIFHFSGIRIFQLFMIFFCFSGFFLIFQIFPTFKFFSIFFICRIFWFFRLLKFSGFFNFSWFSIFPTFEIFRSFQFFPDFQFFRIFFYILYYLYRSHSYLRLQNPKSLDFHLVGHECFSLNRPFSLHWPFRKPGLVVNDPWTFARGRLFYDFTPLNFTYLWPFDRGHRLFGAKRCLDSRNSRKQCQWWRRHGWLNAWRKTNLCMNWSSQKPYSTSNKMFYHLIFHWTVKSSTNRAIMSDFCPKIQ